jgi:hypothetical protein
MIIVVNNLLRKSVELGRGVGFREWFQAAQACIELYSQNVTTCSRRQDAGIYEAPSLDTLYTLPNKGISTFQVGLQCWRPTALWQTSVTDAVSQHDCSRACGSESGINGITTPKSKFISNNAAGNTSHDKITTDAIFTKTSQLCDNANLLLGSISPGTGCQTKDLRGRKVARVS